ncbi:hypothetical protein QL285_071688 [Trifolium repens]|nr:hypothetical protein QL285_071688 [Trifolium repens]
MEADINTALNPAYTWFTPLQHMQIAPRLPMLSYSLRVYPLVPKTKRLHTNRNPCFLRIVPNTIISIVPKNLNHHSKLLARQTIYTCCCIL